MVMKWDMEILSKPATTKPVMIDPFGRHIRYLRLSVTDRCDFRCFYCMEEHMTFLPKRDLLSLEELEQVANCFIDLGVRKLRLTGGEPLMRRNIMWLIERLGKRINAKNHDGCGLDELTLTTNGSQLTKYAKPLYEAGVRRINVSLDSLKEERFQSITRKGNLPQVMEGIFAAKAAGLHIKINMVALKSLNDDEVMDMLDWCHQHQFDLTFIEVMPMGDIGNEQRLEQYWSLSDLRQALEKHVTLTPLAFRTAGPARYFKVEETNQMLGFITPLSHNFCENCNRVRLTCTGTLYSCLGQDDHMELRDIIRTQDKAALQQAIHQAIALKPKGHDFIIDRQRGVNRQARFMSTTGG